MGQALFPPPSIFLFPDFEFEYKARRLFPPPRHRNIFLAQRGQNEGDEGRERERETTNCAIFPRPFFPLNQKDAGATGKAGDANITFIATRVIKRNKFLVVRCLLYLFTFFMALRSSLFLPSLSLLRLFPIQEESSIVATLINMKFNSIARSRFSSFLFFFLSFLSIFFHSKLKETQRENVYQTSYAKLHRITSFPFVPIILYRFVNCFLTNNFPPSFFFFFLRSSIKVLDSGHPFIHFDYFSLSNSSLEKKRTSTTTRPSCNLGDCSTRFDSRCKVVRPFGE